MRSIFGVFKAYETQTGIEVPELTAANCGEKLLGVEQSVFAKAGFVKLKDMKRNENHFFKNHISPFNCQLRAKHTFSVQATQAQFFKRLHS